MVIPNAPAARPDPEYARTKKLFLVVMTLLSLNSLRSQGLHGAFYAGTQIIKLELGYSLSENLHVGGYFGPGFDNSVIPVPSSYGGYVRHTFKKNEIFNNQFMTLSMRPSIGASLGLIKTNEYKTTNYSTFPSNETTIPAKTEFGYCGDAGIEFLYGTSGKFGSYFGIQAGKIPSYFKSISSALDENTTKSSTTNFGFNIGFRFYFQNN